MTRSNFLFKISIFLSFWFCAVNSFAQQNQSTAPNVILINVDDLGWADLGFMGSSYYQTPNLDKLSQQSVIFMQAYAAASNCAPSRASLLTGKYPMTHGIYTVDPANRGDKRSRRLNAAPNAKSLPEEIYTLGEFFKDHGYRTGIFGKWHVSEDPKEYGFDVNVGGNHRGNPGKDGYFSPYVVPIESDQKGEYLTDRLTDEAISFLKQNSQSPFFLYLPFYTVHSPLIGKPELVAKYERIAGNPRHHHPVYAAMIESMDENVGRLLHEVSALNLDEETIVIFTSDNGGVRATSRQDPLRAGKGSYYEGGIRVPLLIRWTGSIESKTSEAPVSQLDLFPTLHTLIRSERKLDLDGNDFSPLLSGENWQQKDLFWHFPIYLEAYQPLEDQARDLLFRTRPGSVIRSGDWKLHEYFEDGGIELYHLNDDPSESQNLAAKYPEKAQELLQKLNAWQKATSAPIPAEINPDFDPDFEREAIKKAGYKKQEPL
ncbi:sulfatase [Algoriphagus halophytocola]|uniref:Sulfatase n=1 Tax=Algoriphagus halophytocola TaxID=2991499 RepID=A0ABY6MH52_9BACT|nr:MULTISPECIES: sulfatase [unclassified Algoriphagus]UZD23106.1 sulfatase [Algoriphagus sp. TR-M5]WBL44398.1 sulfatase [Algoriphagus sp. TR-M9]